MDNTIFYLIGHSERTRLAIAQAVSGLTGARVVDSHDVYRPIFSLLGHDNPATMPDAVWDQVDAVRAAMLETIATMSPGGWSFVFTHAGFDIPGDIGAYRAVRATAARRKARFQPVKFLGGPSKRPLLTFDEPNALTIDVTGMAPGEAAKVIVATAAKA